MFAARLRTVRPRFAAVRAFAASAAPCEEKTLGESAKDAAEGVAKKARCFLLLNQPAGMLTRPRSSRRQVPWVQNSKRAETVRPMP
jgi:hypothetical protein